LRRMPRSPGAELAIALAGPAVNLAIAFGLTLGVGLGLFGRPWEGDLLGEFALVLRSVNLLLAGFNLIPAFPMDGGRVLRALLSFMRPEDEATRIAAWMGRVVAFSLGLYGLVTGEFMLVFFAFFIWLGAAQESAAATGRTTT